MKTRIALIVVACVAMMGLATPIGDLKTFTRTCDTTATKIIGTAASAYVVGNLTTTPIYVGNADVNSTTRGWPVCSDTAVCFSTTLSIDASSGYCLSTGGTATLLVMSGK